jgi:hypothetical protein
MTPTDCRADMPSQATTGRTQSGTLGERPQLEEGLAEPPGGGEPPEPPEPRKAPGLTRFYGRKGLDPVRAIRDLESLLENVINQLAKAEGANLSTTVEINATSNEFNDRVRRTVSENASQLGFETQEFEE